MAERDSLHAFPAKMLAVGVALKAAQPLAVRAGTTILGSVTRAQLRTVAPTLFMSGVGRSGTSVGITAVSSGASGIVKATGPVHLLERPTKAHRIEPKGSVRRKRVLRLAGGEYRSGGVMHPGTRGQYPFRKGITKGLPAARDAMTATMVRATGKALR